MKIYHTGLITMSREARQPSPPFVGAGWTASVAHRQSEQTVGGHEILIKANSWATAQRALNLISASMLLFKGDPSFFGEENTLVVHNRMEPKAGSLSRESLLEEIINNRFLCTSNVPVACAIAAKASRKLKYTYGIMKYDFSIGIHSQHVMDLEPFASPHLGVSSFPEDHIAFAYAIISAYSALEDIGLEIRASAKQPSRIAGKWNPVVLSDLEKRLRDAGIDLDDPLLWTIRGPKRKLEKRRPVSILAMAP